MAGVKKNVLTSVEKCNFIKYLTGRKLHPSSSAIKLLMYHCVKKLALHGSIFISDSWRVDCVFLELE